MSDYHGHATLDDGTHVTMTAEEAEALWKAAEEASARLADEMPETADALRTIHTGLSRLRDLGWREAKYCPKDGSPFAVIEYGSTGLFEAFYSGDWPTGRIYCCDYLCHPDGMLFKPLAELTDDERAKLDECMAREKVHYERQIQSLIASDQDQS